MKRLTLTLAAMALPSLAADAQDVRKVSFRTLCLQPLPELSEVWLVPAKKGAAPVSLTIPAASFSAVVEGTFKGDEVVFFSAAPAKGSSENPPVAARGKLAKSARQLLLLVPVTSEGVPPSYEIRAFDDGTDSFKLGTVRAINLAPSAVRITLAGQVQAPVPSGEHAAYPQPKEVNEYDMYPVSAEFQGEGETWNKVYSASWKASDRRRELVITLFDEKFKQPVVKLLSDAPPWAAR